MYPTLQNALMAAVPTKADVYKVNQIFPVMGDVYLCYISKAYMALRTTQVMFRLRKLAGLRAVA